MLATFVAACAASPSAFADADSESEGPPEIVLTDAAIPYLNADSADEALRQECDWNRTTAAYLASES